MQYIKKRFIKKKFIKRNIMDKVVKNVENGEMGEDIYIIERVRIIVKVGEKERNKI